MTSTKSLIFLSNYSLVILLLPFLYKNHISLKNVYIFFFIDEQVCPREIYVPLETIPESQSTSELVNGHQSSKCADILIYFITTKLFNKTMH